MSCTCIHTGAACGGSEAGSELASPRRARHVAFSGSTKVGGSEHDSVSQRCFDEPELLLVSCQRAALLFELLGEGMIHLGVLQQRIPA